MIRNLTEEKTLDSFNTGFNCAEALSKTIVELYSDEVSSDIPRVATAFGGGIGGTFEETCGALTGGIIAIGYLYGRMAPGNDKSKAYRLASEFRSMFADRMGSTTCEDIRERFGEQEDLHKCKKMTSEAAGMLAEILMKIAEDETVESAKTGDTGFLR